MRNGGDFLKGFALVVNAMVIQINIAKEFAMHSFSYGGTLVSLVNVLCLIVTPLGLLVLCVYFFIKKRKSIGWGIIIGFLSIVGVIGLNSWQQASMESYYQSEKK